MPKQIKSGGNCDKGQCVLVDKNDNIADINVRSSEIKPADEKDTRCAPGKKFTDGSCIPLVVLSQMATVYNQEYPDDQIKVSSTIETLNPSKYKRYLVKQFADRLANICDNQREWVKQSFIKKLDKEIIEDLTEHTFRPKGPNGQFTWLNTININHVFDQYEESHHDFKFFKAVPIDFDDLPEYGLKDLDFDALMKEGRTKIGVVFNLDEHYKSGSHWVALYSDLKEGKVYFSDSYGLRPDKRIVAFMRRIAAYIKDNLNITPVVDFNKTRHQYGNSECGLYSISFILKLLGGTTFEDLTKNRITDEEINKCRRFYFT